jgi:RHS repeat-associated protein
VLVALLVAPSAASATTLPSTISSNTTLTAAGSPYTNGGSVTISSGVTVDVEPGVQIRVWSLIVDGTLDVAGTARDPVVFTSSSDSGAGQWAGFTFNSGSSASVLDHAEVRYAGVYSNTAAITINGVSPTITNSTIRNNKYYGISTTGGGAPEIGSSSILNNGSIGIYYSAGSRQSGEIKIHGNLIEGNGGPAAVYVGTSGSDVRGTTLGDNTIKDNTSTDAVYFSGGELPPDIGENTLSGNKGNYLVLAGTLSQSAEWADHGYPVLVGSLTIATGATLTLDPGVTIKSNGALSVSGTLEALGTSEEPVLFTSQTDSAAGQWQGITFNSGSSASVLDHAEVRYAGSSSNTAAITINGVSPTITNSTIRNNRYYGVFATGGGAPEIGNSSVLNNSSMGIYYGAGSRQSGEIKIHDNLIEGNGGSSAIQITIYGSNVVGTTLGDNTIKNNTSLEAVYFSGGDLPPDIDENTLSGNRTNYISLSGELSQSTEWTNHGYPLVIGASDLQIASKATLTLGASLEVKADNGRKIVVNGTLLARGSANEPIRFTSYIGIYGCCRWGGLVFNAGSDASLLEYVDIRYTNNFSNTPAVEIRDSSPTIRYSAIHDNSSYGVSITNGSPSITHSAFLNNSYGIYVASGAPTIERNKFQGNWSYGVYYGGTGVLSVPHNTWGCLSGPKPYGCGDTINNSKVNPTPIGLDQSEDGRCRGERSDCPRGADPVSLATGELTYMHRDLQLSNGTDTPLEFVRSYNSGDLSDTGLGPGWSQSGLMSASELENLDVLIQRSDSRQDVFTEDTGIYEPPSGVSDTLIKNRDGTFTLTALDRTIYTFDSTGRIATITDDHGLVTRYGYDGNGRLATITDPSSQTLTFSYNASSHITKVADSTRREVSFTYSAAGDLETVTDALGGVTRYAYDANHRLTSITDPRRVVILENRYDSEGRVIEQLDGEDNLWRLDYDTSETVVTEPEGGEITYSFDGLKRVTSVTDQLGNATTTTYDAAGNVDLITRPGRAVWDFGFDSAGNLTSVKDPEGGERSYAYDGTNRLERYTDPRTGVWTYTWSRANDVATIADPASKETTFTYNAAGQPLTVTDANRNTTTFTYDSKGNRLTAVDPLSHTTRLGYDSRNYLTSKTLPGLAAETYTRNALGDLLSRTTPEGSRTDYAYDANGLLVRVTDPATEVWEIQRDGMERPTLYTDPLSQRTAIAYDGNLNPISVTDRRGKVTRYSYDLANQLTGVVRPEGGTWALGYDARGNRDEIVDPLRNTTTYAYDLADRMIQANEPLSTVTRYGYDDAGNLTSFTDPRSYTTTLTYDALNRLTKVAQPLSKETTFTYDPVGNRLTRTTAAGTLDYNYDAANRLEDISYSSTPLRVYGYDDANRLISATDAQGDEIAIGYDDDGQVVSLDNDRGQTVSRDYNARGDLIEQIDGRGTLEFGYDDLGQMTSLTDPQTEVLNFAYDPESNLTEVRLPNGIVTTNTYDDDGLLTDTRSIDGRSTTVESLTYGYDAAGSRTSQTDRLSQQTLYTYDALNRLTEFDPPGAGSTVYGYDAAGNRTRAGSTTYTFNELNQLTRDSAGTTYDYDDAGRLIERDDGSVATTYGWDQLDQLISVDNRTMSIDYTYDALGRRAERDNGTTVSGTHYGDLTDIGILDTDSRGAITQTYVQGPEGLIAQRASGATNFPLADAHGDITTITDDVGAVDTRQTYDPWGAQLTGPALEMGYLGAQQRRSDPVTGLTQMGVRPYDPSLGVFMSEDPMLGHPGLGVTLNRYAYVWDNPLNLYDLRGKDVCDTAGEAPVIGNLLEGSCDVLTYRDPLDPTPSLGDLTDRARDFFKSLSSTFENFSTMEQVGTVIGEVGGAAACAYAKSVVANAPTPPSLAVKAAAAATCLALTYSGAAQLGTDIVDED